MIKKMIFAALAIGVFTLSCSSDDDNNGPSTATLTLNLNGLEELGSDYVYEGWIIVNGNPVSTGTFSGVTFPQTFNVDADDLTSATTFVLSIEPAIDPDPAPAATKLLAGDFSGNSASVDSNGIVGDFSASTGVYILATPTDMDDMNEESGVWFLDNSSGMPMTGLDLPVLAEDSGWRYEGWAVIDGTPVTTGIFRDPSMADNFSGFSGMNAGPSYPGEDFLTNAPSGLTFPADLRGTTVVISVEPYPDNSPNPFTLKPLAHMVPANAMVHTAINMGTGPVTMLSGTVTR